MTTNLSIYYSIHNYQFASLPPEEQKRLKSKDGVFLKCIWTMPNPIHLKGENYVFSGRKFTVEEIEEIEKRTYPALELTGGVLSRYYYSNLLFLQKLGYFFQENVESSYCPYLISFPNHIALQENWSKLQTENPDLPSLKICASQGIASPEDFIEAFLRGEIILSTEKEFLHDQEAHVIPTLIAMSSDSQYRYTETRKEITKSVAGIYGLIEHVRNKIDENTSLTQDDISSLLFALSYCIDVATTRFDDPNHPLITRIQSVGGIIEAIVLFWSAENAEEMIQCFYLREFGRLSVSEKLPGDIFEAIVDLLKNDASLPQELNDAFNILRQLVSE